jgi:YidC/Oxa1 family membrane protein insertase
VNPLNPLYEAVAWVIKQIYTVLSPVFGASSGWTWALSIVLLVVFMRLIMVPLFVKQMHTTRKMTALAPQMTVLRKKYKGDKQTLNTEMMKLYQEAGVNPLMGCLPVVAQLPMFFALFSVLKAIAEWKPGQVPKYGLTHTMVSSAQSAKILGATIADKFLSSGTPLHVRIVILCAVLVSMATTYLTVRQSMKRGMMPAADPSNPMGQSQKYMAYIMPFFALSGLYWPFGLVLYWVTTNLWTLGQQYVLFMRFPTPAAAAAGAGTTGGVISPSPALAPKTRPAKAAPGRAVPGKTPSAKAPSAKAAPGKTVTGKTVPGKAVPGKTAAGSATPAEVVPDSKTPARPVRDGKTSPAAPARKPSAAPKSGPAGSSVNGANGNGNGSSNGSSEGTGIGRLRRLGRSRQEPEPEPEAPEVKLIRTQRQRQSRSKRTGKG